MSHYSLTSSVVVALAALLCACAEPAPSIEDAVSANMNRTDPSLVSTRSGPVSGLFMGDGSVQFRAIPYAEAPVGERRWRAPEPVAPWSDVRRSETPAPACLQADLGWNGTDRANMSEDCLFLEIRTPDIEASSLKPVMVFIHGGANVGGRGTWAVDGTLHQQDVVVATLHYRLGVFGFMAHPALSAEQDGASGNYALMDQQLGLQWIKDNIAAFGGDPENITIFGASAGSQAVALHQQAPASQGLFQRAIQQSGSSNFSLPSRPLTAAETLGMAIAAKAGLPAEATAADLRALPGSVLLDAQQTVDLPAGIERWQIFMAPTIDGRVLTEPTEDVLARGDAAPVPLLAGWAAKESPMFASDEDAARAIPALFGEHTDGAFAYYGWGEGNLPVSSNRLGSIAIQLATDINYRCPMIFTGRAAANAGQSVWLYSFDYGPTDKISHGVETNYVMGFNFLDHGALPIQSYWANFARNGDPNGPDLAQWPPYTTSNRSYLEFSNKGPVVDANPREPLCDWMAHP
ncbi:carboxylesterase/lipase family protein [Parvularcula sp. LCG005]|uniref:carboxylesterase/lipase family protein n=1 Tax=Parvularcula sp. LCG005 TaxID=3078805 RepID=UPI0029431206|nr:carboxylesterase family protein [Parvularcula sp. LCG005]WOI53856.1 carboxylesterase family protein [Parvularcula sp. LCG005]